MTPIEKKIITANVSLLLKQPFFGNLTTRMHLVAGTDESCPTAATDFRNLYYNPSWFDKMSIKQVEYVLCHEVLHCAFEHMFRREFRNPKIWNVACDYVVNGIIERERIGEAPTDIPPLYDPKYDGMNAYKVYDLLMAEYDEISIDELGQLLDKHLDGAASLDGKPLSGGEIQKIKDEIVDGLMQAAAAAAGAGSIPGEIARMLNNLTNPKMDWKQILREQVVSTIKSDFTFTRPNRKSAHSHAILPGTVPQERIEVCVGVDMSGSISQQQASEMLSEVAGIMVSFDDYNIRVWTYDTKVYNMQEFDQYNGHEITEYKCLGGGGTDFMCNYDFMKDNDITPRIFINFTDGYDSGGFGDPDHCSTIFILHGTTSIVAPFGTTVYYDEN